MVKYIRKASAAGSLLSKAEWLMSLQGDNIAVDAYSAFADNQYTLFTPLARVLHEEQVTDVVICGLATDYCVKVCRGDA